VNCPSSILWIRLAGGELPANEERTAREHLRSCTACAREYAGLALCWEAAGRWDVDLGQVDLTERVVDAVRHEPAGRTAVLRIGTVAARAAAVILVAFGLGAGAGRLVPPRFGASEPMPAAAAPREVADSLGLSHLGGESATGLPHGLAGASETEGGTPS